MIQGGLSAFAGKRVLLLQGPMGPFFWRLAQDLRAVGAEVHKINFNAGDRLFYPVGAWSYRGTFDAWPSVLSDLLDRWRIDVVLMFGDCRPMHAVARALVLARGVQLGVFEEGYVRPDYITLERYGVNGHSRLPRQAGRYRSLERSPPDRPRSVGNAYWHGVAWSILYATAATLLAWRHPHYHHHRPLGPVEAARWIRSAVRKWLYRWRERGVLDRLTDEHRSRFFLVPLQVHNDAQVRTHSAFPSVEAFIDEVMRSFAAHAPAETVLVLKHHPMDRPYSDYRRFIAARAEALGLQNRCLYIHDQHLPTLLDHARGVVLVNSTVGLQALHHQRPVKVLGEAIFDIDGLTFRGGLDEFWSAAQDFVPDAGLFVRYREYLIATTQINGSFYRRLRRSRLASGVRWSIGPSDSAPAPMGAPEPLAVEHTRTVSGAARISALIGAAGMALALWSVLGTLT